MGVQSMRRRGTLQVIVLVVLMLVGASISACSESGSRPTAEPTNADSASPDTSTAPEEPPRLSPTELAPLDEDLVVPATANVFGAGRSDPPSPGGGGGGTLPPGWRLSAGSARVVTFPSVAGEVNFSTGNAYDNVNGPAGDNLRKTDVESFEGISGIIHNRNGSFLVGVFLTQARPEDPAPPRLDVTQPPPTNSMAPRIGQVFLIGDGKTYRYKDEVGFGETIKFIVPHKATRLFVGFADAMLWQGLPGYYGNNTGELTVGLELTKK